MEVTIKLGNLIQEFKDKNLITIGDNPSCDFVLNTTEKVLAKLVYSQKYKNYVLVNSSNNPELLYNNKTFTKVLVNANFSIRTGEQTILVTVKDTAKISFNTADDIFNNDIEANRVSIVKEIGYRIEELKNSISSMNRTSFVLNVGIVIMSIISAFGMTNFLLGLRVDTSTSVLKITTNFGFLTCISIIVLSISLVLKNGISAALEFNRTKKFGETNIMQKMIIYVSIFFMFIIYVINLFFYKDIPGFGAAAFFVSLLFVGILTTVSIAAGYFDFQLKNYNHVLMNSEYREDFEGVLKNYRKLISTYANKLSQNRISSIKSNLVNNQMRMIIEMVVGILTAPFLAYGVSNTLASCFPEAANWVRISGLRFSPIFLVLATFLIIFAFLSFVRGFTISKQIKASEIIKFDGFHDYNSHGVTILGLDSMRNLNKEKNIVIAIACFIILIEFTMNVSYFITEIGGDLQGMFLSFVTALVPTALLIAETHLLSSTMHKINNYKELLSMLD